MLSDDHFSVDGTQVQAWASMKSFVANDGSVNRHRPGATVSAIFTESSAAIRHTALSRIRRPNSPRGRRKRGKVRLYGECHNREPQRLRRRVGTAAGVGRGRARKRERHDRALFARRQAHHRGRRQGLRYGDFVSDMRDFNVTPHVAQNTTDGLSAVDGRPIRHCGDEVSQQKRKRVEEPFGWGMTIGGLARPMLRGVKKLDFKFTLTMAAYDLIKLPRLIGVTV